MFFERTLYQLKFLSKIMFFYLKSSLGTWALLRCGKSTEFNRKVLKVLFLLLLGSLFVSVRFVYGFQLKWSDPDEEGMVKFLCGDKQFNEDRVRNGCKKLMKSRSTTTQGRLDGFFTVLSTTPAKRKNDDKKENANKKKKTAGGGRGRGRAK